MNMNHYNVWYVFLFLVFDQGDHNFIKSFKFKILKYKYINK